MTSELVKIALFLGAALCTAFGGAAAGLAEGQIGAKTMQALGRQPKANNQLVRTMLIGVAVTETGAIFSLVIGLLLLFGGFGNSEVDMARAFSFFAAGIAMGVGCMGSSFGSGSTGAEASEGVGRNPSNTPRLTSSMIIGQALTQTSAIFSLIVSLLLLYLIPDMAEDQSLFYQISRSCAYLGAALAIGYATLGAATGVGIVTSKAVRLISRFHEDQPLFLRTMFVGSAVVETCAIYALVIAFLLLI